VKTPLAAIAILIALAIPALADDGPPTLSASGQGVENAAPDIAILTLGVLSRANTARAALDANNADMDKVIATIRAEAVPDRDIATSGFSVGPIYSQSTRPQRGDVAQEPKIVAYQVSNQLRIIVRDLAATGAVLDSAVSAGANQAASISFDIEDRQALVDKAIVSAIAEARRTAELMAEAADVRLVRMLSVNANEGGRGRLQETMALSARAVPVMGGELAVSVNASIDWEIAPK